MYPTLYTARQSAGEFLPRQWYYDDALALPWVRSIDIKISEHLNRQSARGLVYSHNKQSHGGLVSFDYQIIIADGLPPEYERFVTIKELMHCYFDPIDKHVKYLTGTEIALAKHMDAFFGASIVKSAQADAERLALWMAIGTICTEHQRKSYVNRIGVGGKSASDVAAEVADEMRIPLVQAKALLSPQYMKEISQLV